MRIKEYKHFNWFLFDFVVDSVRSLASKKTVSQFMVMTEKRNIIIPWHPELKSTSVAS